MTRLHRAAASIAMKRAWQLARKGAAVFGGSPRQHFAEGLRAAWADVKADPFMRAAADLFAATAASRTAPAVPKSAGYWRYGTRRRPYNPCAAFYAAT